MDAIGLEHRVVFGEAFEQERHQRGLARAWRPRANMRGEALAVRRAVVRRHAACRRAARARPRFCAADVIASRLSRIASRLPPRKPSLPPSSMIAIAGRCCASKRAEARAAAGRRVAADARIDDAIAIDAARPAAAAAASPSRRRSAIRSRPRRSRRRPGSPAARARPTQARRRRAAPRTRRWRAHERTSSENGQSRRIVEPGRGGAKRRLSPQGRMPVTTDESDAHRLRSSDFRTRDRSVEVARADDANEPGRWPTRSFAPKR